jgi:hypothetical protein
VEVVVELIHLLLELVELVVVELVLCSQQMEHLEMLIQEEVVEELEVIQVIQYKQVLEEKALLY